MLIGYARKSTADQRFDLQIDALKRAGCEQIFTDTASGALDEREGLREALAAAKSGDVLVCWKMDRLSRSLQHLIHTVNELGHRGIGFRSLNENLDTTSPGGKLFFHIIGALCEFELETLRTRTKAGLEAARAQGRVGGRPEKMDPRKVVTARRLLADPSMRVEDVCAAMQVSKSTLYRHLGKDPQLTASPVP